MNGLDLLIIAAVVAACIWIAWLHAHAADELELRERRYQDEQNQWAAEIEEVPLDWLDDLDEIRRIPETAS